MFYNETERRAKMNFDQFYSIISNKAVKIYVSDSEENLECVVCMDQVIDFMYEGENINLYDKKGNMVALPDTVFNQYEDGYRCEGNKKIFLFFIDSY